MPPGEELPLEKVTDVLLRVTRESRGYTGKQGGTRNENGELNDFLEKRRPFMNPVPTGASH